MSRIWLFGGMIVVAALVVGSVTIALVTGRDVDLLPADSPEGVVQRYLLALKNEEYAEAYNYLTSDLRDRCSLAVFVRRAPSTRVRDTRLTLEETQKFGDNAFVRASITVVRPVSQLDFPLRPSEYTYERTYNLKREAGKWRMAEPDWWCPPERHIE